MARNSVTRRSEYILQVLRNNGIKERRVEKSTDVNRVNEDEVCVQVNFRVESDSLQACEACRNLLVEKMDHTVECSAIAVSHSPAHRAEKRQQAFRQAVVNAREKALTVAGVLEVRLGSAVSVVEKSIECKESDIQVDNSATPATDHPSQAHQSLHKLSRDSADSYLAEVEVIFEVLPLRNCYHRKCPKH